LRFVLVADWMPGPFEWTRFLAHASLTQGIFNEESISAGVWYVAIDFQLYAMLLFCWVCARNAFAPLHMQASFRWIFTMMCLSSLWYFNRFEAWDNWGIYFVGAYGLGVAVAWTRTHERGVIWYGFLLSMAVTACICFPRGRIALAIVVSMILYVDQANPLAWPLRFRAQMRQWADASYAVFLTHFIWIMLASALWTALDMHGWGVSLAMAILCWLASNVAGRWLHLGVELPLQRCLDRVYLQFITRRDTDRAVLS
jgi:hypothetical protein